MTEVEEIAEMHPEILDMIESVNLSYLQDLEGVLSAHDPTITYSRVKEVAIKSLRGASC